jgi:hypothetical protein
MDSPGAFSLKENARLVKNAFGRQCFIVEEKCRFKFLIRNYRTSLGKIPSSPENFMPSMKDWQGKGNIPLRNCR